MKSWSKYLLAGTAIFFVHGAFAQSDDGTSPQEAPFIQEENEFDAFSEATPATTEEDDALAIEDELNKSPSPLKAEEKKETVNLNDLNSDKKIEEDLFLEEDNQPVVQEPIAEPTPVVEVKPLARPRASNVTRRSPKGGVEYIQHPQAAKGLTTITKDGTYIYKTRENNKYSQAGSFRLGMMDAPRITAADGTTYSDMYSGGQQPVLMFDFEWQPFQSFGRLGVQAGFGLLTASGNGRFVDSSLSGKEAKERYTFVAVPLNLGFVYRLEWMHRQWVAPYISGGGTYMGVMEIRDDGKTPKMVGTPGAYGAGGLLINISAMNRDTAFTLNSEYGIKNLWVSLDYRYLQTFNEDLDFSSSIVGAGIVVDY